MALERRRERRSARSNRARSSSQANRVSPCGRRCAARLGYARIPDSACVQQTHLPSTYDTSASFHVAYGESYEGAARREALEELGLANHLRPVGKFCHRDPPEHQFVTVFTMDHYGEHIVLDPSEATCGRFYTRVEAERISLTESCTPWLQRALRMLTTTGTW